MCVTSLLEQWTQLTGQDDFHILNFVVHLWEAVEENTSGGVHVVSNML